jgi:hypothetical protein
MTTKIYLWKKKSTISDHANASFLAAVDGNGDFYSRHMTITILCRQMRSTKVVVEKCISRLKSPDYSYPLQRLSATKEYKLFSHTTEDFEIPLANYVADIDSTIKTLKQKRTSDGLSKLVTTVPLLSGELIDNSSITNTFSFSSSNSGITSRERLSVAAVNWRSALRIFSNWPCFLKAYLYEQYSCLFQRNEQYVLLDYP